MLTVYRQLLRLYPAEHRAAFGDEMLGVLKDLQSETTCTSTLRRTRSSVREVAGLITGAVQARLLHFTDGTAGRYQMRNGFRFPKMTPILMTLILGGVLVAIQKGENIAYSLPPVSQPVAPIHPVHSGLLPPIPLFFAAFYAAGIVGWIILFALRRSGVHRLDQMSGDHK